MVPIAAVILTDSTRTKFAGIELNERAAHIAHRAGIFDVHFAGDAAPSDEVLARLRRAGWRVTVSVTEGRPLQTAPLAETVVVLPARTIVDPATLVELMRGAAAEPESPALVVTPTERRKDHVLRVLDGVVTSVMGSGNAASAGIAILPEPALAQVRRVWDFNDAVHRLAKTGTLRALTTKRGFCVRLDPRSDLRAIEREYLIHTGRRERLLTRATRALSAVVSQWWAAASEFTYRSPARA